VALTRESERRRETRASVVHSPWFGLFVTCLRLKLTAKLWYIERKSKLLQLGALIAASSPCT
jgi:hypothetical protein